MNALAFSIANMSIRLLFLVANAIVIAVCAANVLRIAMSHPLTTVDYPTINKYLIAFAIALVAVIGCIRKSLELLYSYAVVLAVTWIVLVVVGTLEIKRYRDIAKTITRLAIVSSSLFVLIVLSVRVALDARWHSDSRKATLSNAITLMTIEISTIT